MTWLLVLITVVTTSSGAATETRALAFETRAACEAARESTSRAFLAMKGEWGRDILAMCHPVR